MTTCLRWWILAFWALLAPPGADAEMLDLITPHEHSTVLNRGMKGGVFFLFFYIDCFISSASLCDFVCSLHRKEINPPSPPRACFPEVNHRYLRSSDSPVDVGQTPGRGNSYCWPAYCPAHCFVPLDDFMFGFSSTDSFGVWSRLCHIFALDGVKNKTTVLFHSVAKGWPCCPERKKKTVLLTILNL